MTDLPETYIKGYQDENKYRKMQFSKLGKTGLLISKISFGGGTLSELYGNLNEDEAIATVHEAIMSGINYFDTAPFYGQGRSEEVLGMALKNIPRKAYYVATKVGRYTKEYPTMFDYSAKKTRESVERSLELLGLECIDVVQIHDIEFAKNLDEILNECLPALEKLVQEKKIRFIGVSAYPVEILKRCIDKAPGRFDLVLSYARYTLMDDTLKSYIDYFQQHNLGIVCASAHALGLLTNNGPQTWHPAVDEQKQLCRKAAQMCEKENVELGKLAMYHCIQLSGATTFLTGMQTRFLLEINMSALSNGLTSQEQELLQQLKSIIFTKPINWEGTEVQRYWEAMEMMS